MFRIGLLLLLCGWGVVSPAPAALAEDPPPGAPRQELEAQKLEIEKLKAQVERLQAENKALKEALAARGADPAGGAAPAPQPIVPVLGEPDQKLAGYVFAAPAGWSAQAPKDNKLSMMYRSTDENGIILIQFKLKGGAVPEMQGQYGQSILKMLRQGFARNNTTLIEPPSIINDNRFYLKVREKIRLKNEKVATQLHLYRVEGRDMIELTAITTAEKPEEISAVAQLAEEMSLGVRAGQ